MPSREELEQKIKNGGYKFTPQRSAILDVLASHKSRFLSAEEIRSQTCERQPGTNITTVYRNLEIFEKLEIIHKVDFKEAALYGLICDPSHHHHVICKHCGKTEIIDFCPLQRLVDLAESKNFTLTEHKIELYGHCENCRKKNRNTGTGQTQKARKAER